jgi:serine/threonine-protein kinase
MPRDTLALEAMAGTVLEEKYRLLRVIGSGAMAHVYEAEQLRLGRSVAVKIMRTGLMADKRSLERFRTEGLAASRINHPHAIAIYDLGVTKDGVPFLVMELLRGKTLANLLLEDPFLMERIVTMAAQILSALEEAHTCGVIHRDLKSENVIVDVRRDGSDFSKVLDFGIAAFQDRPDMSIVGTPEYMAPEQIRGEAPKPQTDIYAMGIMLYEMIVGRTPFSGVTLSQLLERHLTEVPQPPSRLVPSCPRELDAIVLRALEKDPQKRFASAREMREALLSVPVGQVRVCGQCGERSRGKVRFCVNCGTEFGVTPTPAQPLPAITGRQTLSFGKAEVLVRQEKTRPSRLTYELSHEPDTLIGRTAELARLATFLEGHEAGACMALAGPQGVGKARLVLEAARRTTDLVMFIAAPDPSGHQQSWYPILSMIEAVLGLPPRPSYVELTEAVARSGLPARDAPGLAELFGLVGPLAPLELAVRRRETYASAVRALASVGHRYLRPVLCFVDIDAYDQPSRKLIDTLVQQLGASPLRIVVTASQVEIAPVGATLIKLGGLPAGEAEDLLVRAVGPDRGLAVTQKQLMAITEGNPAAVLQLAGWLDADNDPASAPSRLVDLVAARLGQLPAAARRLLQAVAAHGQIVSRATIGTMLQEIDPDGKATATLARAGLIAMGENDLMIPFELVAQVAEACTPAAERRALGQTALKRKADMPLVIAAHHAEAAGELEESLTLFTAAGDDAVRRFDDPRAAALYHRAITIARVLHTSGESSAAHKLVSVSLRLADVLRYMGQLALASGCLDEAEGFEPDQGQLAGIARGRGRIALMSGNPLHAVTLLRRAIGLGFRTGDPDFLCETYIDLSNALASLGNVAEAAAELTEGLDALTFGGGIADAQGPERLWDLGLRLSNLHLRARQPLEAKKAAKDSLVFAERVNSSAGQGRLHAMLALILEVLGDTHGALTHQAHALDYMRRLGDRRSTAELLLGCARMTGDLPPVVATTSKKSLEATRRSRERAKKAMEFAQELASEIGWDEGAKLAGTVLPVKGPRTT